MAVAPIKSPFSQLFIDNILNGLFPKEDYKKDKGLIFHYIVNHGKDTSDNLKKWGDAVEKKYPDKGYYDQAGSRMKMTPLHVAVMKGNRVAVAFFTDHGCRLDAQDACGWNPLHHAAARNDLEMLAFMQRKRNASLMRMKNAWGSTPQDFLDLQSHPEIADDTVVCQYQEGDTVHPWTARMFRENTGANFTPRVIATTEGFYDTWNSPEMSPVSPVFSDFKETYVFRYLSKRRPQLTLRRTESSGFEAITTTRIVAGTILDEYAGMLVPNRKRNMPDRDISYLEEEFDGKEWRNLIPMINDGPPNAVVCSIPNCDGLLRKIILVAVRTIQPDEAITYNYESSHHIKWGFYQMSDQQKQSITERWNYWLEHPELKENGSLLQRLQWSIDLHYILTTPEALIHLIINDPSNGDVFMNILKNHGEKGLGFSKFHVESCIQLIEMGQRFVDASKSLNSNFKKTWIDFSIRLIHEHERFFAYIVLHSLAMRISSKKIRGNAWSSDIEHDIRKEVNQSVSMTCQGIIQQRLEYSRKGVKLGKFPVDLEAVIKRIEKPNKLEEKSKKL